ncbi:MAG: amino acid adenylation domain-containing protein [Acidobacteriia bacterium]|nr:amino acid adenylation domain-containing protein [Terriglobia bacterium]
MSDIINERIAALSPEKRRALEALLSAEQQKSGSIPRVEREGGVPLSFAQQRLWFMDQLEHGGFGYNISSGWRLTGPLDLTVLQATVEEIARRHESLRTRFVRKDGHDLQVIEPFQSFAMEITDLRHVPEEEQRARIQEAAAAEARIRFDLTQGPLWRVRVLTLSEQQNVILLTMHHIVSDGWSMSILVREVAAIYGAFLKGKPSPLPELSVQYADYAAWQRATLQEDIIERQLQYWCHQLEGSPVLELPFDHPRPPQLSRRGDSVPIHVPGEVVAALYELCRREKTTLFMVLLAAFQIMLSRYSGQEDIVVGTDVANRNRAELEPLIGFFVNQLVMRTHLDNDPTSRELLQQVRETCLSAYANQDVPFERVVERYNPERYLNREPIFQVKLLLQNQPDSFNPFSGVQLEQLGSSEHSARFDLVFTLQESAGRVSGTCIFATDLFERQTVARMVKHWCRLLEELVRTPEKRISELRMLGQEEIDGLLRLGNGAAQAVPEHLAHELFDAQAQKTPNACAVSCEGKSLSYSELQRRANQMAHYLRSLGVGLETRVAVIVRRSAAAVAGMLAISKAGGTYVPLDPEHPPERTKLILEDSRAEFLLMEQEEELLQSPYLRHRVLLTRDAGEISKMPEEEPQSAGYAENAAYLIYTSGSTGRPKGTVISHRSLVNLIEWHAKTYGTGGQDRASQYASQGFDASIWEIWPTLSYGASLHIVTGEDRLSVPRLMDWISTNGITIAFLPTMVATALISHEPEHLPLKTLLTGADRLLPLAVKDPGFSVVNHYGPTEATVVTTWIKVALDGKTIPIGRPVQNAQTYVLDRYLHLCPPGVTGELFIGGAGLARGYWDRADLTAERFLPNPFACGERIYRTGDRVKWRADGTLEYIGRTDQQLKIRGCRIEPGEIEAALREHELVRKVVIAACEDRVGQNHLVAYVVPTGEAVDAQELRTYISGKLPDYMVPSVFVAMEELPLNANGKLDRVMLPYPEQLSGASSGHVAPRTPVEETVAAILCELMRLDKVSVEANFFELGGHSLLATQVISRIRETFHVNFLLRQMFESPTVAQLAALIEDALIDDIEQISEEEAEKLVKLNAAARE